MPEPASVASSTTMASSATAAQDATFFAPSTLGDKPSGFGASTGSSDVKPLTSVAIDAEVVSSDGASAEESSGQPINPTRSKKRGKKRKGKKRKN